MSALIVLGALLLGAGETMTALPLRGGEGGIGAPPIDPDLLGLVHRGNEQADAQGEKLDVTEREGDITGDDDALVEHSLQQIRQIRRLSSDELWPFLCGTLLSTGGSVAIGTINGCPNRQALRMRCIRVPIAV